MTHKSLLLRFSLDLSYPKLAVATMIYLKKFRTQSQALAQLSMKDKGWCLGSCLCTKVSPTGKGENLVSDVPEMESVSHKVSKWIPAAARVTCSPGIAQQLCRENVSPSTGG